MKKPTGERIQKVLANAGVGSRRQIERWIEEGRILTNGKLAFLGQKVTSNDKIVVDGKEIKPAEVATRTRVLAYHKPVGQITSHRDPQGRPSVFDYLPELHVGRWIAVGRLDINTCGLLLFTNDGELANRLMHPSSQLQREYAVRVLGDTDEQTLRRLRRGVTLDDGIGKFTRITAQGGEGANRWFRVVLTEGRKREVRRLWEAVGCKVSRLIRVRYGNIALDKSLRPGKSVELGRGQLRDLQRLAGLSSGRVEHPSKAKRKPRAETRNAVPRRKKKRGLYRR